MEKRERGDVDIGKSKIYINISNGVLLLLPSHYMSSHLAFTFCAGLRWEVGVNGRCWVFKINFKR